MAIEFGTDDAKTDAVEMLKMLQAYLGGGTGGTGGTGGATDAAFFPVDPAQARFPSPEDSRMVITNGVVGGRPYLLDIQARIHTLAVVDGVNTYLIDSASQMDGWSGHADSPPVQLMVRQGRVYVFLASGAIQLQDYTSFRNAALPPAWTDGSGGGGTSLPPLPPFPIPSDIAPGSSGRVLNVGPGLTYTTFNAALAAAQPGDTIQYAAGTYTDVPTAWAIPLLIDFGGTTIDMTGNTAGLAGGGKGAFVPRADSIIQNGTITGTAMDQGSGQLTCAIRPDDGCGYLTVRNMRLVTNQCGVGHGASPVAITIIDSNVSGNGLPANAGANTHNIYIGEACRRLILTNVISDGCADAHAVKYRGPELIVNGGTFYAENGSCFDIPNGSTVPFKITGAYMRKEVGNSDHHLMGYGEEYQTNGLTGGLISGGTIAALCNNPFIAGGGGGTITASGVTLTGNQVTGSGVTLVGF